MDCVAPPSTVPSRCGSPLLLLTCALLMTSSHSEGLSLVLSPEDPMLELYLNTSEDGIVFQRELLRLGGGRTVSFTAHVVGHAGCWRPGLQFMVDSFAPYFEPWAEDAAEFEGLGSYSWNQAAYNTSRGNALGFKTNWDLSGTWMSVQIPLATENIICSRTLMGSVVRPPEVIKGDEATRKRPLDAVACCVRLLLTCALLMTSSHSKAVRRAVLAVPR